MSASSLQFFHATASNLSEAWARAMAETWRRSPKEISPLLFSFGGLDQDTPDELPQVRDALDECLALTKMQSVQTVANTIFPQALWQLYRDDRQEFFSAYLESLPDYVAMAPSKNRRGLYFARLIGFDVDPTSDKKDNTRDGNQLEFVIQHCKPGVRRSMFQAALFDPSRDQTASAQVGFPCLQHITFVPNFQSRTLTLNAFYATQQLFERAYGNLLGLARLTKFMAGEIDLNPSTVNCYAAIEKADRRPTASNSLNRLLALLDEISGSETQ